MVNIKKKIVLLKHPFVDVILTTLPYYQFVTFEHVIPLKYKPVSQGVLVRTSSIYDLQKIRVYKEMLLPIGASLVPQTLQDIEEALRKSSLLDVLSRLYNDNTAFYYKVVDGNITTVYCQKHCRFYASSKGVVIQKEDKVTNSNMPYRNLTSKEYINKLKNGLI